MASNISTTSYIIQTSLVLKNLETTFNEPIKNLTQIRSEANGTFTLFGESIPNVSTFTMRNPQFTATKNNIAAFMQTYSSVVIVGSDIKDFRFSKDGTFLEVVV